MSENPEDKAIARFRDMRPESLKRLLAYHLKYATWIQQVLDEERKK